MKLAIAQMVLGARMRKGLWLAASLMVVVALFVSGCGSGQSNGMKSPTGTIATDSVHVVAGHYVQFAGRSTLPDATHLQTQLYADGEPEAWWPVDTCVVHDGAWQITVPLSEGEAPDQLDPSVEYTLRVYQQDRPSVEAEIFWFDLAGPPQD